MHILYGSLLAGLGAGGVYMGGDFGAYGAGGAGGLKFGGL